MPAQSALVIAQCPRCQDPLEEAHQKDADRVWVCVRCRALWDDGAPPVNRQSARTLKHTMTVVHLNDGSFCRGKPFEIVVTGRGPMALYRLIAGDRVRLKGRELSTDFVGDTLPVWRQVILVRHWRGR